MISNNFKEKNNRIRIIINDKKTTLNNNIIQIIPQIGQWNDFGYQINCKYQYLSKNNIEIDDDIYFGFFDGSKKLSKIYDLENLINEDAELQPYFFTMQTNIQSYRNIVGKLGIVETRLLLTSLNDIVALRHYPKTPSWVENAILTEVFKIAFLRRNISFFAYCNAGAILDGLDKEKLGVVTDNFILRFKLDGFNNEHSIKFNFDHNSLLPKRICVLIGKNGTGKSLALNKFVKSALLDEEDESKLVSFNGDRPVINRIIAIATPGETSNTFPVAKKKQKINYRRLILTRGNVSSYHGIGELLVQLARTEESIKTYQRWDLFIETVRSILPIEKIYLPIDSEPSVSAYTSSDNIQKYVMLNNLKYNKGEQSTLEIWGAIDKNGEPLISFDDLTFHPLSSGQLSFIKFAIQACLYIENGSIVLLDEPETHLHPNFISDFIKLLDRLLELTGSLSIIATHSSYFVREVPRDQVNVFSRDQDNNIYITNPRLKTFGADVGSISYFVFEDEINNAIIEKLYTKIIDEKKDIDKTLDLLKTELSSEAIMELKRKIEFS